MTGQAPFIPTPYMAHNFYQFPNVNGLMPGMPMPNGFPQNAMQQGMVPGFRPIQNPLMPFPGGQMGLPGFVPQPTLSLPGAVSGQIYGQIGSSEAEQSIQGKTLVRNASAHVTDLPLSLPEIREEASPDAQLRHGREIIASPDITFMKKSSRAKRLTIPEPLDTPLHKHSSLDDTDTPGPFHNLPEHPSTSRPSIPEPLTPEGPVKVGTNRRDPIPRKLPVAAREKAPARRKTAAQRALEAARAEEPRQEEVVVESDSDSDVESTASTDTSDGQVNLGSSDDEPAIPDRERKLGNRKGYTLDRLSRRCNKGIKYPVEILRAVMSRIGAYDSAAKPMLCQFNGGSGICLREFHFGRFWSKSGGILDHLFTHFKPFIHCNACPRKRIKASTIKSHFAKRHPEMRIPQYSYNLDREVPAVLNLIEKCIPAIGGKPQPEKEPELVEQYDLPSDLEPSDPRETTLTLD